MACFGLPEGYLGVTGLHGVRSLDDVTADIDAEVATDFYAGIAYPPSDTLMIDANMPVYEAL